MEIQYEKSAIKYLKGSQKPQRELILEAIEKLTHKPAEGDIKRMLEAAEIFTNSIPLQRKGVSL